MNQHTPSLTWLVLSFIVGFCVLVAPAQGQLHVAESGGYVVRANVASAQYLPPAMLEKYNLRAAALLINVVVLKQGEAAPNTGVEAAVAVETSDLLGILTRIDMRTIEVHSGVSYMGTFDPPLNDVVLDFDIVARPAGSDTPVRLRFRERLPQLR